MLEGLNFRVKKSKEKVELDRLVEPFLEKSFFWDYLVNFNSTPSVVCSLKSQ